MPNPPSSFSLQHSSQLTKWSPHLSNWEKYSMSSIQLNSLNPFPNCTSWIELIEYLNKVNLLNIPKILIKCHVKSIQAKSFIRIKTYYHMTNLFFFKRSHNPVRLVWRNGKPIQPINFQSTTALPCITVLEKERDLICNTFWIRKRYPFALSSTLIILNKIIMNHSYLIPIVYKFEAFYKGMSPRNVLIWS